MEIKSFKQKYPASFDEYLECTIEAEKYVSSFLVENDEFTSIDFSKYEFKSEKNSYYKGNAGLLHMYLQLNALAPREEYDKKIRGLTRYIGAHFMDDVSYAKEHGEFVPGMAEAFYTGLAGIGLVMNEVFRLRNDQVAKETTERIISYYICNVSEKQDVFWSDNSAVFFDGGIILYLIDSLELFEGEKKKRLTDIIIRGVDHILANGIVHPEGGLEIDYGHVDFKHKEPNFEFGTAGAGYLFAKAYELTGNEKYIEAAKETVKYLLGIAVKQKKGYLIPYKLTLKDNLFYLGNCHGPVGTIKLFLELYRVTGQRFYYEQIEELCDGMESLGAPVNMSSGYWNTTCVCCGPAGFVPLYTWLYRENGNCRWKKLAKEVGSILLGTNTNEGAPEKKIIRWDISYDRTNPGLITAPIGYYDGAAGIITALLQLYIFENPENNEEPHIYAMIDDPYNDVKNM